MSLGYYRALMGRVQEDLILDLYPAVNCVDVFKRKKTFSGNCLEVRRSSDNTTQDIGFDSNGYLDTASLLSFVGAGDGFVRTWYDQEENGDFFQNTNGNQPKIVESGSLITLNGVAAIKFEEANEHYMINQAAASFFTFMHDGTKCSFSHVSQAGTTDPIVIPDTRYSWFSNQTSSGETGINNFFRDVSGTDRSQIITHNTSGQNPISARIDGAFTRLNQHVAFAVLDESNATTADRTLYAVDGASLSGINLAGASPVPSSTAPTFQMFLGANPGIEWYLDGYYQSNIIWDDDQESNYSAIVAAINDSFNIY